MRLMKTFNLIDLIVGIFCFIVALWAIFNTLDIVPCVILFWLSGMNIGIFLANFALERGGARSQDYWNQNEEERSDGRVLNVDLKNNKVRIEGEIPEVTTELSFLISCLYVRMIDEGYTESMINEYIATLVKNSIDYGKREGCSDVEQG